MPSRLEPVLAPSSKPGKVVWILWEGVATQILEMPAAVVNGLDRAQLHDALSFEAEPLTGIGAGDSAIDGVRQRNAPGALAEFQRFWITQIAAGVRADIDAVIAKAGAKLGGITHPGGLPVERWDGISLGTIGREWRRIEIWDQVTFSLHGRKDASVETRIIRSSPGSEAWVAELPVDGPLAWMGPGPVTRVAPDGRRVRDALTPLNAEGVPLEPEKIDLPPGVPVEWLRAWAREMTARARRIPIIDSSLRVSPNRKFYLVGGLAAALALGACTGHGLYLSSRTAQVALIAKQREAQRLLFATPDNSTKKEEAAVNLETKNLQATLADLDQARAKRQADYEVAQGVAAELAAKQAHLNSLRATQRLALAQLLGAMADAEQNGDSREILLKEIRQEKAGDLRLIGLCKQAGAADSLARTLEARLSDAGWRVGAAEKQLRADGLAFDFAIVLTPLVLIDATGAPPRALFFGGHTVGGQRTTG